MTVVQFPRQRTDRQRAEQHIANALTHIDEALRLLERAHVAVHGTAADQALERDVRIHVLQTRLLRDSLNHTRGGDAA